MEGCQQIIFTIQCLLIKTIFFVEFTYIRFHRESVEVTRIIVGGAFSLPDIFPYFIIMVPVNIKYRFILCIVLKSF